MIADKLCRLADELKDKSYGIDWLGFEIAEKCRKNDIGEMSRYLLWMIESIDELKDILKKINREMHK